jgi:hypothetical protein
MTTTAISLFIWYNVLLLLLPYDTGGSVYVVPRKSLHDTASSDIFFDDLLYIGQ